MSRAAEELRKRLVKRELIVVAGAGVSIAATERAPCASWRGLLVDGVEHCREFGDPPLDNEALALCSALAQSDDIDLLLAAAWIIESRLRAPEGAEWRRWLDQAFKSLKVIDPDLTDAIRGLGVPVATTNYDSVLEEAMGGNVRAITWRDTPGWVEELSDVSEVTGILHFHGWWREPESVVLGAKSYSEVLRAEAAQEIQRALGRFKSLLFVGYGAGIDDPNIGPLLRWLADENAPNHRHYILVGSGQAALFGGSRGVHPVEYGPTFEFLPGFLRELVGGSLGTSVRRDNVSIFRPGEDFAESDEPPTPRMIVLSPGKFEMGSSDNARPEELPRHAVYLDYSFAVSRTPITFDDWDVFLRDAGVPRRLRRDEGWGRGQRPVVNVNWFEALEFLEWLNAVPGIDGTYRLLSEAEWEYAARGGSVSRYWWGDKISADQANYDESDRAKTTPVTVYATNPFGLLDVHGNVWEWTQDVFHTDYKGAPTDGSPWIDDGPSRVIRGGCWYYDASYLTASSRLGIEPGVRFNGIGFRIARTIRQPLRDREQYALISVGSGKAATRTPNGTVVQQRYAAASTQIWEFVDVGEATFVVRDPVSGAALSVASPIDKNSSAIVVSSGAVELEQSWEAVPDGDGYLLRNTRSGKVLDVDGISADDGTQLIQFARHGNVNQRWWPRRAR